MKSFHEVISVIFFGFHKADTEGFLGGKRFAEALLPEVQFGFIGFHNMSSIIKAFQVADQGVFVVTKPGNYLEVEIPLVFIDLTL